MIDFLVVGGGIAGLSAGARLSALGKVHLCETEDALGYHASGRSAAVYEPRYGLPEVQALSIASADEFAARGVLSPLGMMLVGLAEDPQFEADAEAFEMREIPVDEARGMVPILDPEVVVRAAYHEAAEAIDTDAMLQGFARELRGNGGTIQTRAPISAIARVDGHWQVTAGGEVREARHIVNAAGAWADGVAGMAGVAPLGLVPHRRSVARIAAPEGVDVTGWPLVMGSGESWYMRPDAGALIVSPADATPCEPHDAWADDMVLAEGLARFEEATTARVTRMIANWAGLRTFAPDRRLVIGPDPHEPSFLWFAGQGGYGFQTAPAASRLLADLVAGVEPALEPGVVRALRPDRLRTGG